MAIEQDNGPLNLEGTGFWGQPSSCGFVTFQGSPNPDSPRFGPDEICGEDAVEGEEFCARHLE